MAKRRMTNKERAMSKVIRDRKLKIEAAIDAGLTSRKEIAEAAGVTMSQLSNAFTEDRELYAKFCILRKTIVDMASDNIAEIVADPTHPKNYDASKYILSHYKSDLDSSLESKDEDSLEVAVTGESKSSPIVIKFRKSSNNKDED